MQKLAPNKNHKKFLSELCLLLKDFGKITDYRDKETVYKLLEERIPPILNNFDKSHEQYEPVSLLLTDTLENLLTILKFIKEDGK